MWFSVIWTFSQNFTKFGIFYYTFFFYKNTAMLRFFYKNTAMLESLELFLIFPTLKPKIVLKMFLKLQ